jgi:hypothetical protein
MVESLVGVGQESASALGDRDPEFGKDSTDGIDASRTAGEVPGAKAVEGRNGLLVQGLHGDSGDILVASGLQESPGIGPIRLVADPVAGNVGRREQGDLVAEGLKLSSPVVSGAAGFHEDMARRLVKEELPEPGT